MRIDEEGRGLERGRLKWPLLVSGSLVKRYQRFKADVKLDNGEVVTALCPNTGTMLTCSDPGRTVHISYHDTPSRKLKYTWEMIEMPGSLVGINTGVPNRLVKLSIEAGKIKELSEFERITPEVRYGTNSRIDLLLEQGGKKCFVEVKNCTLVMDGTAYFPDAVTTRGLKHLKELQKEVSCGNRAVMFYLVQRMDAQEFRPASYIDPVYGLELEKARDSGVEILAYDVTIDLKGISINKKLPFRL
jgi:sugar fermentation stimulation protein A